MTQRARILRALERGLFAADEYTLTPDWREVA